VRRQFGIHAEWQSLNERLEKPNMSEAVSAVVKEAYVYDQTYMFCPPSSSQEK